MFKLLSERLQNILRIQALHIAIVSWIETRLSKVREYKTIQITAGDVACWQDKKDTHRAVPLPLPRRAARPRLVLGAASCESEVSSAESGQMLTFLLVITVLKIAPSSLGSRQFTISY